MISIIIRRRRSSQVRIRNFAICTFFVTLSIWLISNSRKQSLCRRYTLNSPTHQKLFFSRNFEIIFKYHIVVPNTLSCWRIKVFNHNYCPNMLASFTCLHWTLIKKEPVLEGSFWLALLHYWVSSRGEISKCLIYF